MKWDKVALENFIVKKRGSVNPAKFLDESFELYSIPAYDKGKPEFLKGNKIGSSKKVIKENDVLLSRIVPHIRRSWVIKGKRNIRRIGSGEWIVFNSKEIESEYLKYFFFSGRFSLSFMQNLTGVGGSLLRANPGLTGKIKIPLPPLQIQKQIAEMLDSADSLRQTTQEQLEELEQLEQSVFLDMFGDVKLNPKKWAIKMLGEVADILTGFAFKSEEYVNDESEIKLCGGINVMIGELDWSRINYWRKDKSVGLDKFFLKEDDIVIAMDRPWIKGGFKIATVEKQDLPILLIQRTMRVRANSKAMLNYLYFVINQKAFYHHCHPTETTVPHISPKDFKAYKVPMPPKTLIEDFLSISQNIKSQKQELKASLKESEDLFNGLLQEIFN